MTLKEIVDTLNKEIDFGNHLLTLINTEMDADIANERALIKAHEDNIAAIELRRTKLRTEIETRNRTLVELVGAPKAMPTIIPLVEGEP